MTKKYGHGCGDGSSGATMVKDDWLGIVRKAGVAGEGWTIGKLASEKIILSGMNIPVVAPLLDGGAGNA